MANDACPDREQLEQLLLGKLPEAEREALGEHLLWCEPCTTFADTIVVKDELTEAIRARRIPHGDEDVLAKAIARGKLLSEQLETLRPDGTVIPGTAADFDATMLMVNLQDAPDDFDFLAPAQQPDEIGRLGDYRVLQVLGLGGMGVVFRAEDPRLKRQVALKAMKPAVAASRAAKDRFLREAQFTASIEHDNIVHIYQVGEDRGIPFRRVGTRESSDKSLMNSAVEQALSSVRKPPSHPPGKRLLATMGAGGLLLMLSIIVITILDRNGKETVVRLPPGTDAYLNLQPGSKVRIREESDEISATIMASGEPLPTEHASEISNLKSQTPDGSGWHGWPVDAPTPAIAPFNAAQAKAHQEAWAKHLGVPVEYTNSIGMKFVLIPPGEFTMGSTPVEIEETLKFAGEDQHWKDCIKSEAPQHRVILTQPVYLGVHEVMQADYQKVMGLNPSHFAPTGAGKEAVAGMDTSNHPVDTVSWNDVAEFCAKLSEREKLKPFYFRPGEAVTILDGTGYRLPTEADWEFACRAGTTTRYWIGDKDEDLTHAGWFGTNSGGRTHAVGGLKGNPFGLYDVHGNVLEWVRDWWEPNYFGQFQDRPSLDPNGPSSAGSMRVVRGGDWFPPASGCRASSRGARHSTSRGAAYIGFRVSLPVDAVSQALKVASTSRGRPATTGSASAPLATTAVAMSDGLATRNSGR